MGGVGVAVIIPMDVPKARLLVGPGDEADVFLQGEAQVFDRPHGHQGGQDRALVVIGAAAVEQAVHQFRLEGRGHGPALAGVGHVQVA